MCKCKTCSNYVANDNKPNGSCIKFGNKELIKQNSAVFDSSEDDMQPSALVEVGENFGCIHYQTSLF